MPIIRVNISKEFSQLPDSEEEKKIRRSRRNYATYLREKLRRR